MNIAEVVKVLKTIRIKYSRSNEPEWFATATDEEKAKYETMRNERYEALNFAVNLVRSYRTLETAKTQIEYTLSMIDKGEE